MGWWDQAGGLPHLKNGNKTSSPHWKYHTNVGTNWRPLCTRLVLSRLESRLWCALGQIFIDRCSRGIFPKEHNLFLWHSHPEQLLLFLRTVFSDTPVQKVEFLHAAKSNDMDHAERDEYFHLFQVSCQTEVPPFKQAAVSFRCHWNHVLLVESHSIIINQRCSITTCGTMDIHTGLLSIFTSQAYHKTGLTTKPCDNCVSP